MLAGALDGWADGPRLLAEASAWGVWGVGVVAVLDRRPWGLTAVRLGGGVAAAAGLAGAPAVAALEAVGAVLMPATVLALAALPEVGAVFANGDSYGTEERFPLRTPPVLALVAAPLGVVVAGAGALGGPLLLADGQVVAGVPATLAGWTAAGILVRSVHSLSRRWLILVPGGIVIHDPLTLEMPVLLPRQWVVDAAAEASDRDSAAFDLRAGSRTGTVTITLADPLELPARGRPGDAPEPEVRAVRVALARPGRALSHAKERRLTPAG